MVSNDSVQGEILHKNLCQNNVDSEKAIEGNAALRNRCANYNASSSSGGSTCLSRNPVICVGPNLGCRFYLTQMDNTYSA